MRQAVRRSAKAAREIIFVKKRVRSGSKGTRRIEATWSLKYYLQIRDKQLNGQYENGGEDKAWGYHIMNTSEVEKI